ncbi:uncharacterized protein METZ01_LOCUS467352, partial [marine metagenome]
VSGIFVFPIVFICFSYGYSMIYYILIMVIFMQLYLGQFLQLQCRFYCISITH